MHKHIVIIFLFLLLKTVPAAAAEGGTNICALGQYIVKVDLLINNPSTGQWDGFRVWSSSNRYYDPAADTAVQNVYTVDMSNSVNLSTTSGRALYSAAINAMNMGYKVDILSVNPNANCAANGFSAINQYISSN